MGKGKKKNLRLKLRSKSAARPATVHNRNWGDLPGDVVRLILSRLGTIDILASAQLMCVTWYNVCKDPRMWRTIDMHNDGVYDCIHYKLEKMCRYAVERSAGNLVAINIEHFATDDLLDYITERSSRIRRLRLVLCYNITDEGVAKAAAKLPLLEDLEISLCKLSSKSLEAVGRCCPLLRTLKFNRKWFDFSYKELDDHYEELELDDDYYERGHMHSNLNDAYVIGKTMPGLEHLQLLGNKQLYWQLKWILNGCPHLQSLDLRLCPTLWIERMMMNTKGITRLEQIKELQLPPDDGYSSSSSNFSADELEYYYDDERGDYVLDFYGDVADFYLV